MGSLGKEREDSSDQSGRHLAGPWATGVTGYRIDQLSGK